MGDISQVAILGLEISLPQLPVDALLNDRVILQQHLPVLFLQHRQLVSQLLVVLSQHLYLTCEHLHPVLAFPLHLSHPSLDLHLAPGFDLLFSLLELLVVCGLGCLQLILVVLDVSLCVPLQRYVVVSCSPQVFVQPVQLLLQFDDVSVALPHYLEGLVQLIVMSLELVSQGGLVIVLFGLSLIDLVLGGWTCINSRWLTLAR